MQRSSSLIANVGDCICSVPRADEAIGLLAAHAGDVVVEKLREK